VVFAAALMLPPVTAGQPAVPATPGPENAASTPELNKLTNPVSSVWSLNFQSNFQFFEGRLTDEPRWFTILCLYSPLEPFFDKTWRPSEIEPVN
jgi:hypothetical protein